jgi:hypothetical protein
MTTMLILAIKNERAQADGDVRIRIVRKPVGVVEGMSLSRLKLGEVYDLTPTLANYLVLQGFAAFESRRVNKAIPTERRNKAANKSK